MSNWIVTYSGLRIELDNPEANVDRFLIRDVAHSLSMQCRFNGHCSHFYSVAEHSVLVERQLTLFGLEIDADFTPTEKLTALLHDAPEYILGDMTSPQKQMDHVYRDLEQQFSPLIAARWQTIWPLPHYIKDADREMYTRERRDLFLTTGYKDEWAPFVPDQAYEAWPFANELSVRPQMWAPGMAEHRFLERFKELVIERDNEVND